MRCFASSPGSGDMTANPLPGTTTAAASRDTTRVQSVDVNPVATDDSTATTADSLRLTKYRLTFAPQDSISRYTDWSSRHR